MLKGTVQMFEQSLKFYIIFLFYWKLLALCSRAEKNILYVVICPHKRSIPDAFRVFQQ